MTGIHVDWTDLGVGIRLVFGFDRIMRRPYFSLSIHIGPVTAWTGRE